MFKLLLIQTSLALKVSIVTLVSQSPFNVTVKISRNTISEMISEVLITQILMLICQYLSAGFG